MDLDQQLVGEDLEVMRRDLVGAELLDLLAGWRSLAVDAAGRVVIAPRSGSPAPG